MTELSKLKLYATRPHPCSYLEGEDATTVFIDPAATVDAELYSELSRYGFRRSGGNIYRPHCESCHACVPIRILTEEFQPNRSQRRCFNRNSDLKVRVISSIEDEEYYQLYENYIGARHADGDMYPASRSQYREFLTSEWGVTRYIEIRDPNRKLIGVAVTDALDHGLSAVYTFFDTNSEKRSLGTFAILYQIELAKQNRLPYLYLGYWIRKCQKMNYKTHYCPHQVMINQNWVTVKEPNPNNAAKMQLL